MKVMKNNLITALIINKRSLLRLTALDVSKCYLPDAGLEALTNLTDLIVLEATQKQS